MPKPKMLRVYPNPFCADLDHEDRAHGRIPYEPNPKGDPGIQWVGVTLRAAKIADGPVDEKQNVLPVGKGDRSNWDHVCEYDLEPVTVPPTGYYLRALTETGHHGPALLPADEDTHLAVHGTRKCFRDHRARLAQLVAERGATPKLAIHPKLVEQHTALLAKGQPLPERDHEAEWAAFVAPALKAEKDAKDSAAKTQEPAPVVTTGTKTEGGK